MKFNFFLAAGLFAVFNSFGQTTSGQTTSYPITGTFPAGAGGVYNVFLGNSAGINATGNFNFFAGYEAGSDATNLVNSVLLGFRAGKDNTGGSTQNVFIGNESGRRNFNSYSVYVGNFSGANTTGYYNTSIGFSSGAGNTMSASVGNHNSFFGQRAGDQLSGNNNVIMGSLAGATNSSIGQSVYIGFNSGRHLKQGSHNVFIGTNAGAIGDVSDGSIIGEFSAYDNTYVGSYAGQKNTSGSKNVFLGRSAGLSNGNGNNNVYLGFSAGSMSTGSNNIFLGYNAGQNELNSNRLYIANTNTANPLVYGEFRSGSGSSLSHGMLKFNAQKVGVGYDSTGAFGDFPAMSTINNASIYRFFVKGGILAEEVRVRLQAGWADYVFAKDYKLMSLKDTEKYIANNGHLPNMPSAAEVEADGVELGNIVKLQQEKIEELTLHLIEQDKQIELLKEQNKEIETLKAQMQQLLKKQ